MAGGLAGRLAGRLFRVAALIAGVLLLSGCGYKALPRPSEEVLPRPSELRVQPRPDVLLVSWAARAEDDSKTGPAALSYEVVLEQIPETCLHCPPTGVRRFPFAAAAEALIRDSGRLYAVLAWPEQPSPLRIYVTATYAGGRGLPTGRVAVRSPVQHPLPTQAATLAWRWAMAAPADAGARPERAIRPVRLAWEDIPEGSIKVLGAGNKRTGRAAVYRVNLYRRLGPAPWPLTPLNPEPLAAPPWIDAPFAASESEVPPAEVRYVLRLVDRFGSEGPPSAEVTIRHDSEP